ncbi:MAG: hypothetical protein AB9903_27860 [Vulcanimicrobiota bacterium]
MWIKGRPDRILFRPIRAMIFFIGFCMALNGLVIPSHAGTSEPEKAVSLQENQESSLIAQIPMGIYTPEQMQVLMSFKPTELVTSKEKKKLKSTLDIRENEIELMEQALKDNKPAQYYKSLKKLLWQSEPVKEASRKAKVRLLDSQDKLENDFEVFGDNRKKWPEFARLEQDKLKKGRELYDNFIKVDDLLCKYVKFRMRNSYEICIHDPETFPLNQNYLRIGLQSSRDIVKTYRKLYEELDKADKKARAAEKS